MDVRRVVVFVLDALVTMSMRVLTSERRIVCVRVMCVVVTMHMLVLDVLMRVAVTMLLGQVKIHAESKQTGSRKRG